MLSAATLAGGFADPAFESQAVFRALMTGFSRPGAVSAFGATTAAPAPFGKAAASVLLALCDFETPVWLSPALCGGDVCGWVNFHCGAPLVQDPARAAFAFSSSAGELPQLSAFGQGSDEYPDTSTTLTLEVEALEGGRALHLEGPGVKGSARIAPQGLPGGFTQAWAQNGALFPRGIDLILTAGGQFVCLPRTTRIREA